MAVAEGLATTCPRCGAELPAAAFDPAGTRCQICGTYAQAIVFPALFRKLESAPAQVVIAGEAACYFHPERVAAVACARCGRFLCQFCRIDWGGEDLCPACLAAPDTGKGVSQIASSRFRFDSLALAISTLPILTIFLTIFTAPLALGIALFTFRKECSVAPRSKVRFVAAIVISLAQILAWILVFFYSVRQRAGA
ncbi:MAG: hypothetical protein WA324_27640 [Bryobacteraceae bacterium]